MTVRRRPMALAAVAALALGVVALVGPAPASASPARAAATGGCRAVGGGPVAGGGPSRATVVVDTGTGPVWSACISFSGSISGIEAISRAAGTIADLDPVFDVYTGLGRAVCRLRGVGSDPPDCLGKSTNYWSYSHNGRVAPVGAGAVTVHDGDVEGWRYGTGGMPRAATAGTEAAAVATTTAPPPAPTTAPPTPTTRPSTGSGTPGATTTPAAPGTGAPLATPTAPPGSGDATTSTTSSSSTTEPPGSTETTGSARNASSDRNADEGSDGPSDDELAGPAAAARTTDGDGSGAGGSDRSALPSVAGFLAALAAVGVASVIVRRRRLHVLGG